MATGDKTLKQGNRPQLVTFLLLNGLAIASILLCLPAMGALFAEALNGDLRGLGKLAVVPALLTLVLGVINWILPAAAKETLVFWRLGPHRLPSSRAFTVIAPNDPRIDMARLTASLGVLPIETKTQSSLWYATYRRHGKEPAVVDANRAYLLYRDMTALVPFVAFAAAILFLVVPCDAGDVLLMITIVFFEYAVLILAGRNAGTRLVANVLAIESAGFGNAAAAPAKPRGTKVRK